MSKFFLAFRGGMPKTKEEGEQMMADWNAWVSSLGPAMLDPGAGFGKSRLLTAPGTEAPAAGALSGYSIIDADDIDAALAIAGKCPIFSLEGTIEVAPCIQM